MKRILIGAAATLFAIAPVFAVADCGPDHATMASSATSKKAVVAEAAKAPPTAATKVAAKHVKPAPAKATTTTASSGQDTPTVVAKTN